MKSHSVGSSFIFSSMISMALMASILTLSGCTKASPVSRLAGVDIGGGNQKSTPEQGSVPSTGQGEVSRPTAPTDPVAVEKIDPPEVAIGQRLFRETRFNQYFASHSNGKVNSPLPAGDPIMEMIQMPSRQLVRNPYSGKGINCASCHFVDELQDVAGAGNRAYNDFASRSPIPAREDGRFTTPRNSPAFVNSTLALEKGYEGRTLFLHHDGEFATAEELVKGSFVGRNFGWLVSEGPLARAHLAKVIREDDGTGELGQNYGGSYAKVLLGTDPAIAEKFRLPTSFRINVATATDAQIMDAVGNLVGAYLKSLIYARDEVTGEFNGSPYDAFLLKNHLPRRPSVGESDLNYARRLLSTLEHLPADQIRFVNERDGKFKLHKQAFVFGSQELEGLKTFFREPNLAGQPARTAHQGNCIACHAPPAFTDFSFHNTGASQEDYDAVHGPGTFAQLHVPSYAERLSRMDDYMTPSQDHPFAKGKFAAEPTLARPGFADLGVWNVFGNPAIPHPQGALKSVLCAAVAKVSGRQSECGLDAALSVAIGSIKTPTVRNLGQSAPYLHTGREETLEGVVGFYVRTSELAREQRLRNPDPETTRIRMGHEDETQVAAFLRSLNEDYH